MKCPKCGQEHAQKKGTRAGKQRFRCPSCGACFTEGTKYIKQIRQAPVEGLTCPACGSHHIRRDGIQGSYQRYECFDCRKNFTEYTLKNLWTKVRHKCPYCGGELNYSGYGKRGQRKYVCRECHRSCSADASGNPTKRLVFRDKNTSVKCPECSSLNITKRGFQDGKRRYICGDCGRNFLDIGEKKRYTHRGKQEALNLIKNGADAIEVAPRFGYSASHLLRITREDRLKNAVRDVMAGQNVNKVISRYKINKSYLENTLKTEYAKESISQEQKNLIIKFGVYLDVPVDYMAEYIPCSEHKCIEVMQKYKKEMGIS